MQSVERIKSGASITCDSYGHIEGAYGLCWNDLVGANAGRSGNGRNIHMLNPPSLAFHRPYVRVTTHFILLGFSFAGI
jgi:hypothetical protein